MAKDIKLDVKDKKILVLLSEYSRMPVSQIAKKVNISRDVVSYKIKRMQDLGIIQSFYPELDFRKLGYRTYHILMLIDETNKEKQNELIDTLTNHPNTRRVIQYSDRWDLEVILIAKDVEEFDSIVSNILGKYPLTILEKGRLSQITTYYSILFPYHFHKPLEKVKISPKKENDYQPDEKDIEILKSLAKDCRQSTYQISKQVNLSADAIGLRIKKLFETGIIKKFTILPNLFLLGYNWHTFAMQMKVFSKKSESKFKMFVKDHPNIIKAVKTLGVWDLLLYIIAEDQEGFHKTIKEIKTEFSDVVKNYETWVAYKELVFNPMPRIIYS